MVLIIGILAAIAMPQYRLAVAKARTTEALTVLDTMKRNLELAKLEGTSSWEHLFDDTGLTAEEEGEYAPRYGAHYTYQPTIVGLFVIPSPYTIADLEGETMDENVHVFVYSNFSAEEEPRFACISGGAGLLGGKVCTSICGSPQCDVYAKTPIEQ